MEVEDSGCQEPLNIQIYKDAICRRCKNADETPDHIINCGSDELIAVDDVTELNELHVEYGCPLVAKFNNQFKDMFDIENISFDIFYNSMR